MGKDDRKGKRVDRNSRTATRVPELGYYIIVTDTEEIEKNDTSWSWLQQKTFINAYGEYGFQIDRWNKK